MKKLLLLLCFSLFSLNNSAQNSAKDKLGSWYMYNGSHKLSEKFALKTMAHYRYFELANEFQQSIYRLGINYKLNSKINFTAGISYADTDTEYQSPSDLLTEFRLYEDINVTYKLTNLKLKHRFRFEHRFMKKNNLETTESWLRYDINASYPISKNWNIYAFNEVFFNFKGDLIAQNWTGAGFLYKLNQAVTFKTGYFYQKLPTIGFNRLQLGVVLNTNHTKK
jgi:hypothetical protein